MIISDKFRYVFVEFPQTGCSAVAKELMENYDGRRILFKHAQYHEFLKQATPDQESYFSFSTIRHPMDVVVSKYFKYKSDHENYGSKKVKHGKLRRLIMPKVEEGRRDFIVENDADFESFFLKFYTWPYSAWSILSHHKLDYLMRFENLNEDFTSALEKIGIQSVRELPQLNKTGLKTDDFTSYYSRPETRRRAVEVFGPYMQEWGYTFPNHWKEVQEYAPSFKKYHIANLFRKVYWRWLR